MRVHARGELTPRRALEARGWVNDLSAVTLAEMPEGNPPFSCVRGGRLSSTPAPCGYGSLRSQGRQRIVLRQVLHR
jgi:hypothetical protein